MSAPELHGRLPWLRPEDMNEDQRAYYDSLLSGPRPKSALVDDQGRLYGAFNARLLDPPVGTAIQQMGAALRYGSALPGRQREITILTVARLERCDYEWYGHIEMAHKEGLTDEQTDALRRGEAVPGLSEQERTAQRVAEILVVRGDLTDDEYAEAAGILGLPVLFDVISLVGHYRHTAMSIRIWRVPLHAGDVPVFVAPESDAAANSPSGADA